jgi:sigma-B regulation protein RsbU (phosphoserine phosphatase)
MDHLFLPFHRGTVRPSQQGLGLYIASQIALAHGGRIDVVSNAQETRFTFSMPDSGLTERFE